MIYSTTVGENCSGTKAFLRELSAYFIQSDGHRVIAIAKTIHDKFEIKKICPKLRYKLQISISTYYSLLDYP